jgi:hypothetical protein
MASPRSDGSSLGMNAINEQVAGGDPFQAGDHAQQRGLAAAGRADEDHEFPILDVEVDPLDDLDVTVGLARIAQLEFSHGLPPWHFQACRQ